MQRYRLIFPLLPSGDQVAAPLGDGVWEAGGDSLPMAEIWTDGLGTTDLQKKLRLGVHNYAREERQRSDFDFE